MRKEWSAGEKWRTRIGYERHFPGGAGGLWSAERLPIIIGSPILSNIWWVQIFFKHSITDRYEILTKSPIRYAPMRSLMGCDAQLSLFFLGSIVWSKRSNAKPAGKLPFPTSGSEKEWTDTGAGRTFAHLCFMTQPSQPSPALVDPPPGPHTETGLIDPTPRVMTGREMGASMWPV